ncbi:helix-turn-helix transcriptional regulator [Leuconostoc gelidum subsp. gelidum]|uniref:Helix-turn-helix transcriptional regulator n=1 Tax=Leuconostoc gelidum subsp. gelidum TaxID=1607839 RepID=A0AB35FZC8_LEUGE|nr:helix-turn-helix transcriptional regulator [Leuconostoc gelidum]MBZ5963440.1 helix-turn-helix transcriptional regulator [Leuconostoc gelidum subsp. gelidum]MBZ5975965.1 helix-turn-helix transcriptional regulator [Leuconostoc gelidum subsp. gelidum]MBZ5976106.1 helix-turn-helix transcriptional regulator [Leuconostoc gelidum subsp. gelidum]MBZ5985730.1 helix-turn-helix transcriptional regulator [Leuconostoc gelidum subsp. gelidum]MBZ5999905.1 helix-turn-helix transcriptional regulator [Leucon
MNEFPDITIIAKALSNTSKMKILDELMDSKGHTVTELSRASQITAQTVNHHLNEFMHNNWVTMERSGRFHYFFLTNSNVALLIEQLSSVPIEKKAHSLQRALELEKDELFRTCYDHMAGHIGVLMTQALLNKGYLDTNFIVTPTGVNFLKNNLAINTQDLYDLKRQFSTKCLDWSERQHHIGGALGHALLQSFKDNHFITPHKHVKRALILTPTGNDFFQKYLDISI